MISFFSRIFRIFQKQEDETHSIFKKVPMFQGLSKRDLTHIERIIHRRHYSEDEIIFHQDEPGFGLYIIESGRVAIVWGPNQQVLVQLHDGDFFGELDLLEESPRIATAIAKAPSILLCLFMPDFIDLVNRNPRLGARLLWQYGRILSQRLKMSLLKVGEDAGLKNQGG